jgi:hypothetical protein
MDPASNLASKRDEAPMTLINNPGATHVLEI